jgi:hypothetical protein
MFEREHDWREHAGPIGVEPPTAEERAKKLREEEKARRAYPYGRTGEKKQEPVDRLGLDKRTKDLLNALHG